MRLNEAVRQISDIHRQTMLSGVFRGYRSLTVGFTGLVGVAAALLQPCWVQSPATELGRYLALWVGVAAVNLLLTGAELWWRANGCDSRLVWRQTHLAVSQFAPCLAVGGLLTLCIYRASPEAAWMLPGLWSLVFALGIFSSLRLLPRQAAWVAWYFVLCGCACLLWGRGEDPLAPWQMGVTFGGGQLFGAAVLYWTLERPDARSANG